MRGCGTEALCLRQAARGRSPEGTAHGGGWGALRRAAWGVRRCALKRCSGMLAVVDLNVLLRTGSCVEARKGGEYLPGQFLGYDYGSDKVQQKGMIG